MNTKILKKARNTITILLLIPIIGYSFLFWTFKDPEPSFKTTDLKDFKEVRLSDLDEVHVKKGMFKSIAGINYEPHTEKPITFAGQEVRIEGNPNLDRVLVGVMSNFICRIEVWNKDSLIHTKEIGFRDNEYGSTPNIYVEMYDQTNEKYEDQSKIMMRFCKGIGFLGNIGEIALDLTEYGDLSGAKTIGLFSKVAGSPQIHKDSKIFSSLKIWKNWNSKD